MGLLRNCKETSLLMTQSLDGKLRLHDYLAMRGHMLICRNCSRFMKQMRDIRNWLRLESEAGLPGLNDEARNRIATRLQKEEQDS